MAFKKIVQSEFDVKKWLDSEALGHDTCGSYKFCSYCTKLGDTPCQDAAEKRKVTTYENATVKRLATLASKKNSK